MIGDLTKVGAVMTRYFSDKRFLSETTLSHPPVVAQLLSHLEPFIEGYSLAGAGGGGFLAALLKPDLEKDQVVATVREAMAQEGGRHRRHDSSDDDVEDETTVVAGEKEGEEEAEAATRKRKQDDSRVDGDSMWDWHATVDRQGLVVQIGKPCY